mmetsp:Transcript_97394/g.203292  ORF Transcript_97394/g.203292 Transcript_97394/m.203292 type:complete len:793 (-) Transcript_97394:361-2739(-)
MGQLMGSQCSGDGTNPSAFRSIVGWPGLKVTAPEPAQRDQLNKLSASVVSKHKGKPAHRPVKRAKGKAEKKELYKGLKPAQRSSFSAFSCWASPCCTHTEEVLPPTRSSGPIPSESIGEPFDAEKKSDPAHRDDPGPPTDSFPPVLLGPPIESLQASAQPQKPAAGYGAGGAARTGYGGGGAPTATAGTTTAPTPTGEAGMSPSTTAPSKLTSPSAGKSDYNYLQSIGFEKSPTGASKGYAPSARGNGGAYGQQATSPTSQTGGSPKNGGQSPQAPQSPTPGAPDPSGPPMLTPVPMNSETGGSFGYTTTLTSGQPTGARPADAIASTGQLCKSFKSRYTLGPRLSAGAQGVVYTATANFSGLKVIVKKPNDNTDLSDYTLLASKSHPNIVRVYELFVDPQETFIVMEHCPGGDLFHAIEALKQPTQNWASAVFRQAVWGIRYLHEFFGECHNDIKPENILLDRRPEGPTDVPRVMVGDFGCLSKFGMTRGGDPRYRAPETFATGTFGTSTDVWSLGVTLFEIASGGHMIYIDSQNLSSWDRFLESGNWAPMKQALDRGAPVSLQLIEGDGEEIKQLKALLGGMLNVNVAKRWTLMQVLESGWMRLSQTKKQVPFSRDTVDFLQMRANAHVLNVALLNLLAGLLQGHSIQHYQDIWARYDTDSNGRMGRDEFARLVEDLEITEHGVSAEDLFALVDGNSNGFIEFKEFVGWMFSPEDLTDEERLEFFKQAFLTLAGDDQRLSAEELAGVFATNDWQQAKVSSEVVQKLFQEMDVDENGYVDFAEFSDYLDHI